MLPAHNLKHHDSLVEQSVAALVEYILLITPVKLAQQFHYSIVILYHTKQFIDGAS